MSVYKPFRPQDYAVVPFNAHKQYDFTSASAAANKVEFQTTFFDYNSPVDEYTSNNIRYSQIEHMFYRNYFTDIDDKFGDINYLKHKRALYERANVISIPSGLYGHKINPGSFFLSSSFSKVVDDTYGNLIIEGTNVNDYVTDPRKVLLDIGPVKGFKRYDLNIYDEYLNGIYYKKGQKRVNTINSYNTPSNKYEYDDSYFLNKIYHKNTSFNQYFLENHPTIPFEFNDVDSIPCIDFNGINSEIKSYHDPKFNFNYNDDFSIEFWVRPSHPKQASIEHIIGKSTTKTIIPTPSEGTAGIKSLSQEGSSQPKDVNSEPQFPFEIYLEYVNNTSDPFIKFKRSNGEIETIRTTILPQEIYTHIVCRYSSSKMSIFYNGVKQTHDYYDESSINGEIEDFEGTYQNNANLYIGSKGGHSNYFSGSLSQIKIYNKATTENQINNNFISVNGSPYIGNIFYSNGIATITHPKYQNILSLTNFGIGTMTIDDDNEDRALFTVGNPHQITNITQLKFEGSHLIYENEYQCNLDEHEYNITLNPSARKHKSTQTEELADFATGSLFKPYITTIGLYNEKNELLVVGKLGQPIKTSNETDTTFIVRWDT
jgi:hypothetical protein